MLFTISLYSIYSGLFIWTKYFTFINIKMHKFRSLFTGTTCMLKMLYCKSGDIEMQ